MHARPRFLLGVIVTPIVTLVSCASLDPLQGGTCGNGVVDYAEDCDSHDIGTFQCGAPGSAHACKITCDASHGCPDGWGCAVDGVCRQPSGAFPAAADPVSSGVNAIHIGDFDGDGRKDILGTGLRSADNSARARVLYFGADAALEHTTLLSAPIASPTIRNIDQDADNTDDFAFGALDFGFGVMTGRKDRTLVPELFPSFTLPKAEVTPVAVRGTKREVPDSLIDVADPKASSSVLGIGQVNAAGTWIITSLTGGGAGTGYSRALAGITTAGLVGPPVWGDLFNASSGADSTTCGEVVVAFNTSAGGEIDVFSPCTPSGQNKSEWASDVPPVRFVTAEPLASRVHLADVDGDGHLDILYATQKDPSKPLAIFYAPMTGIAPATPVTTLAPPANAKPFDKLDDIPLASGDLNGDGAVDFVTPSSFFLSAAPSSGILDGGVPAMRNYEVVTSSRRTKWTAARVGNFSSGAKKGTFVVAASSEQPDIEYFQGGTGAELPTPSTIPTNGPITALEIGDFDGDTQDDIAYVETNSATGAQDLVYAYGNGVGSPSAPAIVGSVANTSALVPGPSRTAAAALAVFTSQAVPGSLSTLGVALVLGSGDRQPLAPLILGDQNAIKPSMDASLTRQWTPVSVMSGPLVDPNRIDLAAIGVGYTFGPDGRLLPPPYPYPVGPWVAQGTGQGTFGDAREVGDLLQGPTSALQFIDPTTYGFTATIIAADIDKPKNGVVEILGLGRTAKGEPQLVVVRVPPQMGAPPDTKLTSLAADGFGLATGALRALDVDGDGAEDVVALLGTASDLAKDGTKLVVYLNQGGTFRAPPGLTIPIPAPPPNLMPDIGPTSVSQVTIAGASPSSGGAATRALAITTQKRVFLAKLKADKSGFDLVDLTVPLFGASGLRGATGIGAGDFDGDGVEDLAIADAGSVRIVLQQSTQAARGSK